MGRGGAETAGHGGPEDQKPSALAILSLLLGLASWVFGGCPAIPGVVVSVAELLRIQHGKAPAAGRVYAWVGFFASLWSGVAALVVLLVFGGALAALFHAVDLPFGNVCEDRLVCTEEGQCGTSHTLTGDALYRCYVRNTSDCQASEACRDEGRCAYDPRVSLRCIRPGRSPSRDGPVASVCERSADCVRWGRCGLVEGACLAVSDEDCARSLQCVIEGRCSLRGRGCVAASDADCAGSLACELHGRCGRHVHPVAGAGVVCAAPGRDLASSCIYGSLGAERCAETGECIRDDGGVCESLAQHGRRSPRLEEARRRFREAVPVERPHRPR